MNDRRRRARAHHPALDVRLSCGSSTTELIIRRTCPGVPAAGEEQAFKRQALEELIAELTARLQAELDAEEGAA